MSKKPAAAAPKKPVADAEAADRAIPIAVVIPNFTDAIVLEFALNDDEPRQLLVSTHAVIAWLISGDVEPITVQPADGAGLRCLVESHGSEMSYTFLTGFHDRFPTITAATAFAREQLGGV